MLCQKLGEGGGACAPVPPHPRYLRPYCAMCMRHSVLSRALYSSLYTIMPLFNQALQTHDFYTVVSKKCHKMDVLEAALMETLNTPTLSLKLDNPYRTFRTAREIEKDGHGNYISGVIEFNPAPKSDEVIVNYFIEHLFQQDEYCFGNLLNLIR